MTIKLTPDIKVKPKKDDLETAMKFLADN